jgi:DNA-binding NarL/FixJ family response regulator
MKPPTLAIPVPVPAKSINSQRHPKAAGGSLRPPATRRIRVLLADDHPVVRRGVVACLEQHAHLQIVGEAADGQEALLKARELLPDVLLIDINMPHLTGLEVTKTLHNELPQISVVLLSVHANTPLLRRWLQSGASGCILKQASPEEFLQAIETVHGGQPFFSADVARVALNHMVCASSQGPDPSDLTSRGHELLSWIAEGLSTSTTSPV